MKPRSTLRPVLAALARMAPRRLWLGGALLALLTVLMGMALLGLSGWFITATALAGLVPATAIVFDVFMPSAGIRLLALGRTGTRYAERLVTHDATLAVLAALRERLLRSWATPAAALSLRLRPARLLQRLTADVDALDSLYLRLFVPLLAATGATLVAALALGLMRWWLGLALAAWLLATGLGLPRQITAFLGGYVFGGPLGAVLATLGTALGQALDFTVARTLGREFVLSRFRRRVEKLDAFLKSGPFRTSLAIRHWVEASNLQAGLLFRGIDRGGRLSDQLCVEQVNRIYKQLARKAGLTASASMSISGHSLRVGAARDLLTSGADLAKIMAAGRWSKTDTVMRYVEQVQGAFISW